MGVLIFYTVERVVEHCVVDLVHYESEVQASYCVVSQYTCSMLNVVEYEVIKYHVPEEFLGDKAGYLYPNIGMKILLIYCKTPSSLRALASFQECHTGLLEGHSDAFHNINRGIPGQTPDPPFQLYPPLSL